MPADIQPLLSMNPHSDVKQKPQINEGLSRHSGEMSALEITHGSFSWDLKGEKVILSDIDVKIPKGRIDSWDKISHRWRRKCIQSNN